jgi:hypothetical protein
MELGDPAAAAVVAPLQTGLEGYWEAAAKVQAVCLGLKQLELMLLH